MAIDTSTRAFIMALRVAGNSYAEIADLTGLPKRSVRGICDYAIKKGFDVNKRPLEINDSFFIIHGGDGERKTVRKKAAAKKKVVLQEDEAACEGKEELAGER